jgi:hypothetical protein
MFRITSRRFIQNLSTSTRFFSTGNPSVTVTQKDYSLEKRLTALELQHMKRKGGEFNEKY